MKIVRIQSHEVDNCFKENSNQDLPCSQCDGIMLESDYVWTVAKEEGFHFCSLQCLQDYFELNKPFNQGWYGGYMKDLTRLERKKKRISKLN